MVGVGLVLGEEFGSSLAPGEASHFGSFFSSAGSKVALLVAFFRRLVRSRTLWVAFFSAPGQKSHFWSLCFVCFFCSFWRCPEKGRTFGRFVSLFFRFMCVFVRSFFVFFSRKSEKKSETRGRKKAKTQKTTATKSATFFPAPQNKAKNKTTKSAPESGTSPKSAPESGPSPKSAPESGPSPKSAPERAPESGPFLKSAPERAPESGLFPKARQKVR